MVGIAHHRLQRPAINSADVNIHHQLSILLEEERSETPRKKKTAYTSFMVNVSSRAEDTER